jgi:hypothetical protein
LLLAFAGRGVVSGGIVIVALMMRRGSTKLPMLMMLASLLNG